MMIFDPRNRMLSVDMTCEDNQNQDDPSGKRFGKYKMTL